MSFNSAGRRSIISYTNSGKQSSTPAILKRPARGSLISPGRSVKFQLHSDLRSLLNNFLIEKNRETYEALICQIRDAESQFTDEQLVKLITETDECVPILHEELKLFVQVILLLKWVHRSDEVVNLYKNFINHLCSVHNFYTKFALQQLVAIFPEVLENSLHGGCTPSDQEEKAFRAVHDVIRNLLRDVPLSSEVLVTVIKKKFPFRTESERSHLNYVHNLLTIAAYEPKLRREILYIIVNKLITEIDTKCSKEDIEKTEITPQELDVFAMDVDDVAQIADVTTEEDMKHELARKLDYCLHRLNRYVYSECHDKNGALKLNKACLIYQDFLHIFDEVILPTRGWIHTPFTIFYLVSFNRKFTENFVNYLWSQVTNLNVKAVTREAAVYYLAGFLCHASFVSVKIIKSTLISIVSWLHAYIDASNLKDEDSKVIISVHTVFYSTCQALFYLINLRHNEFVNSNKGLKFLANLNLGKIVMSRFNPLNVCKRSVVDQFIKITKTYQLAYCVSLLMFSEGQADSIDTNDLWLNGSFPFDGYLLTRSSEFINPIRHSVKEMTGTEAVKDDKSDDEDFIPVGSLSHSPLVPVLSCSPFFGCSFGT